MNPQVGQQGVQNPFLQMLERAQSSGAPQAPNQNMPGMAASAKQAQNPVGAVPSAQAGGAASGLPGVQQPDMSGQDASFPGSNPGTTKGLLQASSALHGVITQLSDPNEIRVIRTILMLLQRLIVSDQQKQNENTGRFNPQAGGQQPPQPTPPGGSPIGLGPQATEGIPPNQTPVPQNPPGM